MKTNSLILAGFTVWLIVGLVVGARSVAIDTAAHDAVVRDLARVVAVDADLQRDVLAARYGLLTQYDPLVARSTELADVGADVCAAAGVDCSGLFGAIAGRRAAVEAFKPKNATLSNSLRYLPVAVDAFVADARLAPAVVADARDLDAAAFAAFVARSAAASAAVDAAAQKLTQETSTLPEPLASDAALLARHAVRVAADAVALQAPLEAALAPTVATTTATVQAAYLSAFRERERTQRGWRNLLWGWGALTFACALVGVRKLAALYASLEARVRQRTNELFDKNAALEKKEAQLKEVLAQLVELEGLVGKGMQAAAVAVDVNAALDRGDVAGARAALRGLAVDP